MNEKSEEKIIKGEKNYADVLIKAIEVGGAGVVPWVVLVIALEPRDLSADIKFLLIVFGFSLTVYVVFSLLSRGRKREKDRDIDRFIVETKEHLFEIISGEFKSEGEFKLKEIEKLRENIKTILTLLNELKRYK